LVDDSVFFRLCLILKPKLPRSHFRPAVLGHIFAVIGVDGLRIAAEQLVIVTVQLFGMNGQDSALPDQQILHADFFQRLAQIADQIPQLMLCLTIATKLL
jgi:hypothetical protein